MNYRINYNNYKVSVKHKKNILEFINILRKKYSLNNNYFTITFKQIYHFGTCEPSLKIHKRESKITINKDLLKEELFEELKGTLAHEFAHFYHYINFTKRDYLRFSFKMGLYSYLRKYSKARINLFPKFAELYEQITDLTTYSFGFSKELIALKRFMPIYRKNIPKNLLPKASNYLDEKFLKELKDKKKLREEILKRHRKLKLVSLRYE